MQITFPSIPTTLPAASRDAVMVWQMRLLTRAEDLLGPRSPHLRVYEHQFDPTGPVVRYTFDGTGVSVFLSMVAETSWQAAIFELAHETIHLLDPVVGNARIFEEGVAILFSLEVCREVFGDAGYNAGLCSTLRHPSYSEALELIHCLGPDALAKARKVRERCGSLSQLTVDHLRAVYPQPTDIGLCRLCETFPGRSMAPID